MKINETEQCLALRLGFNRGELALTSSSSVCTRQVVGTAFWFYLFMYLALIGSWNAVHLLSVFELHISLLET